MLARFCRSKEKAFDKLYTTLYAEYNTLIEKLYPDMSKQLTVKDETVSGDAEKQEKSGTKAPTS